MKNIRDWTKGKPPILCAYALICASGAYDMEEVLRNRNRRLLYDRKIPAPPLDKWLSLYRKPFAIPRFVSDLHREFSSTGEDGKLYFNLLVRFLRDLRRHGFNKLRERFLALPEEVRTEAITLIRELEKSFLASILNDLEDEIKGVTASPDQKEKFTSDFWSRDETSFFLLVWIPCYLLHRSDPHELYKQACRGNSSALLILVRVDPYILSDQRIGTMLYNQSLGKQHQLAAIFETAKGERVDKISTEQNITRSAAIISLVGDLFRHPLTEPEIRRLFDALAIDFGRGDQEDLILPSPDSFYKAIKREKEKWIKASFPDLQSDKK